MRKSFTLLFRRPVLMLKFFFVILFFLGGERAFSQTTGSVKCYADKDHDGYGNPNDVTLIDGSFGCPFIGRVEDNTDCNDNDGSINPNTVWYKDFDNDGCTDGTMLKQCTQPPGYKQIVIQDASGNLALDCDDNDHYVTADARTWWPDPDHDGYIVFLGEYLKQVCRPPGFITDGECVDAFKDDCNQNDPLEHPDQQWYPDLDGDGYPGSATPIVNCTRPAGYKVASELIALTPDCNDNNPDINPGTIWYKDADNDGYTDGSTLAQCDQPSGYISNPQRDGTNGPLLLDCNDNDPVEWANQNWYTDNDGDGYGADILHGGIIVSSCSRPPGKYFAASELKGTNDCDDNNAAINPENLWVLDKDNDGYYTGDPVTQCSSPGTGYVIKTNQQTGDCDDNDASVNPATEWFLDADNDGYYSSVQIGGRIQCESPGQGWRNSGILGGGDCNDKDATINPATIWYLDNDNDGYNDKLYIGLPSCTPPQDGKHYITSTKGADCNDNDATYNPETVWVLDADGDGYYTTTFTGCLFIGATGYVRKTTQLPGDCDDNDASVHGLTWYKDYDDDGYSDGTSTTQCDRPNGYKLASELTATSGDCDDKDPAINAATTWLFDGDNDGYYNSNYIGLSSCTSPGAGWKPYTEFTKGVDCDDNDATVTIGRTWYKDADNDGYSDGTTKTQCDRPTGYKLASELTAISGDCDDTNASVHGTALWYKDADNDNYSDGTTLSQCTRPTGYKLASELTATSGDCDDTNASVHTSSVWYKDADNDGYSDGTTLTQCIRPIGYKLASELTATSGDCDDTNASVHASAVWYKDTDNDGYSDGTTLTQCARPIGYKLASELTATSGDCDDTNASVHAASVWYKDTDNDGYSDGTTKTQCTRPTGYKLASELKAITGDCNDTNASVFPQTYYADADKDGYGNPAKSTTICSLTTPAGYVKNNTDCNDADAKVHTMQTYYQDADGDGYGNAAKTTSVCSSIAPAGYVSNNRDCNDANPAINPGAVEICGNGIDDNCNGSVDEKACLSCRNAIAFLTTNITRNNATLNWVSVISPISWHVQYKSTKPGSQWIDVNPDLTGSKRSLQITGLSAKQSYQWHIRAKCGNVWTDYSVSVPFTTTNSSSTQNRTDQTTEEIIVPETSDFDVQASPNPTNNSFRIAIVGGISTEPVKLVVTDLLGRVIETRMTNTGQTITIGEKYINGLYLIQAINGKEQKLLKLIKLN